MSEVKNLLRTALIAVGTYLLLFVLLSAAVTPQRYDIRVGMPADATIYASEDVVDTVTTEQLRDAAAAQVDVSYKSVDESVTTQVTNDLSALFERLLALYDARGDAAELDLQLSPAQLEALFAAPRETLEALFGYALEYTHDTLISSLPEGQEEAMLSRLERDLNAEGYDAELAGVAVAAVRARLQPNMLIDEETTQLNRERAREEVEDVVCVTGEVIVRQGAIVTPAQYAMLEALGKVDNDPTNMILGCALMMLALMVAVGLYMYRYELDIARRPRTLLLLGHPLCAGGGAGAVLPHLQPLFRAHGHGAGAVAHHAPGAAAAGDVFHHFVVRARGADRRRERQRPVQRRHLHGASDGLRQRPGGRHRAAPPPAAHRRPAGRRAGGRDQLSSASSPWAWSTAACPATRRSTACAPRAADCARPYSASACSRSSSGSSTSPPRQSCLELSNPNQPLLRRMLLEAPGSYHHSIIVANLAETAASAIGANGLLARVGAYYHDVGKLKRPMYFKENQMAGDNPHDRTDPRVSAAILTAHTRDGYQMGLKARLPEPILDIIRQHHGDSPMVFFYDKAVKLYGDKVDISAFRYEGPRPRSREAAVVMLADTIEAAARALPDPDPEKVDALIHKLVRAKMTDGQLDESELTFADLERICRAFQSVLSGVFHERIEYPDIAIPPRTESEAAPAQEAEAVAPEAETEDTENAP